MSRHTFLGGCVITVAAVAGCYTVDEVSLRDSSRPGTTTTVDGTDPANTAVTGLPCSVARVLANSCASCHAQKLSGGAPNRMLTWEDLSAVSITDGVSTVAEVALARMKTTGDGMMPPAGALDPKDIEAIEKWVAAGSPAGECSDATIDPTNYDTPTVCSSGEHWTKGNSESPLMKPGSACISCHKIEDAPAYSAAGTVYLTAHEPNDCNGHSGDVKVVITDAAGKTYTQAINSVGNFTFSATKYPIKPPYRAKIVSGSKTREMKEPQKDGDCNKCHSEKGNEDAPGRVMAP